MAYYETLAQKKYMSWDHNLVIMQEIRQSNDAKQETKISVDYKATNKNYETDWIPYPFKQGENIVTVLKQLVPILKSNADTMLPIVELNQGKIKTIRSNSTNDQFMIEEFLNKHDLLSPRQLGHKTGLSVNVIATQLSNIVQDHSRSGIGLKKEDIAKVKLTQNEYNLLTSNARLLPKYAFKKLAVKHILEHKKKQENQYLKVFPYFNGKYYVDMSFGEV
ncbi:hypothetical protein [Lactobacillus crispatus]|jgi:hypothetical protein|uniref:Uncharacterized protein n=2 Tax=Lactobacillus crispatus TaxID=47770 RepID=K1M3N7_9LACO|nr:hypothetical protein [Lactobacillus crispatus]EKB62036.1 hypothetical protein HMPREF9249_02460 [Lactobacillus crispatus FB077-07]